MNLLIEQLDKIDLAILRELQADGRLSNAKLSEKLSRVKPPAGEGSSASRPMGSLRLPGEAQSEEAWLWRCGLRPGYLG
jgi:hypothetical protein